MKKTYLIITLILTLTVILASCKGNTIDESLLTSTKPESITAQAALQSDGVYIDTSSDAGLGYKFCYNSESLDGEIGIADSDGNVILSPAYVSVEPITEDRFIARKTDDDSPKSAIVDENGKELIPFFTGEIRRINAFADAKTVVLSVEPSDGKRTFTDADGKRVTSLEYDITGKNDFYGFFTGDAGDKKYIYDQDGELTFVLGVNETADFKTLDHGYTMVIKNCDGRLKYGLKNAEKLFIPCEYDEFTVISKDRIVARIGALDGVDPSDIARIFDAQGTQISTDGEFGTLIFAEGSTNGIALGFTENGEIREWVVDTNGKQVSAKYESVKQLHGTGQRKHCSRSINRIIFTHGTWKYSSPSAVHFLNTIDFIKKSCIIKSSLQNKCYRTSVFQRRSVMPPKPKYTKEEIIAAALSIVSKNGISALTAKSLGNALGTSATPIFTVFDSMQEVQDEVKGAAMKRFESYAHRTKADMPAFKQVGMQMIFFAKEEPWLYQLIFMSQNNDVKSFEDIYAHLGGVADECLAAVERDYGLPAEDARVLFEHSWVHTYGIATLCATGMCDFSHEQISEMLTQDFTAMMILLKNNKQG